jgi:hypothetical protein
MVQPVPLVPPDNFIKTGVLPQPKQLAASAAARLCDHPNGPTAIGFGGARGGGKSFWLVAQMVAPSAQSSSSILAAPASLSSSPRSSTIPPAPKTSLKWIRMTRASAAMTQRMPRATWSPLNPARSRPGNSGAFDGKSRKSHFPWLLVRFGAVQDVKS